MQHAAERPAEQRCARAHLETLLTHTHGSFIPIAKATGLHRTTLENVRAGQAMTDYTRDCILTVGAKDLAPRQIWADARKVRTHIQELLKAEDSNPAAIAAASGTSSFTIRELLAGRHRRVHPRVYRAIMCLTPATVRAHVGLVSPHRAITRLRALQANRWPLAHLAAELGYRHRRIQFFKQATITAELDQKVEELYRRVGDRKGPSEKAARMAKQLGYWPPIHYDDDMNLIPESIPSSSGDATWDGDRFRRWLRIMAFTARGESTMVIGRIMGLRGAQHTVHKSIERVRRDIGLRLIPSVGTPDDGRVMPGQDALLRAIEEHTKGIALHERIELLDDPGLDYKALWYSLCDTADLLNGAGEAGTPAAQWPEPAKSEENGALFAATLAGAAA